MATVTTLRVTSVTSNSAESGGNVTADGGADVTARGVCWNTITNPTTSNFKTTDGKGTGSFTSSMTGLQPGKIYYLRAYATNSIGIAYGDEINFTLEIINDVDGNTYNFIRIGTQFWMAENLKTTRYKNGTTIPLVTDNNAWGNLTTPGYCWYNNEESVYKATYGALYNWYTVSTGNLCHAGWHVPTDAEWTTLTTYLGGESVAGGKLKETGTAHWASPNTGATNETGFTALPGGHRYVTGPYTSFWQQGYWWSSSEYFSTSAWHRAMYYGDGEAQRISNSERYGFSVRCLRDL
jgi:uncharacterized protein (TIGR02145 family)